MFFNNKNNQFKHLACGFIILLIIFVPLQVDKILVKRIFADNLNLLLTICIIASVLYLDIHVGVLCVLFFLILLIHSNTKSLNNSSSNSNNNVTNYYNDNDNDNDNVKVNVKVKEYFPRGSVRTDFGDLYLNKSNSNQEVNQGTVINEKTSTEKLQEYKKESGSQYNLLTQETISDSSMDCNNKKSMNSNYGPPLNCFQYDLNNLQQLGTVFYPIN
jgi:hypothetical protein